MASPGARARAAAAEAVDAVVTHGRSLDAAIATCESRVAVEERAVMRMLAYGALRYHWRLQAWIGQLVSRPLKERDSVIRALLAVGLFQLSDTRIPDHAAVSLTVDATRALRRPKLAGLVNACLRRFRRDELAGQDAGSDEVRWNHPGWLIDRIRSDWPDDYETILTANNEQAPMWLRSNVSHQSAAEYRGRLAAAGIDAGLCAAAPDALRLREPQRVSDLPGFADGDVSVQDAAAQLAARRLMESRPSRVLDACAAPGGKSGHVLELGGEDVALTAVDVDANRARQIHENLERLGRHATILVGDASKPEEWWDGRAFDAILLDAPCSASGVIRRHPDIKLLRRQSDVEELSTRQRTILDALWPLLVPGGRLLYVTCSVLIAENDAVVGGFLEARDDAIEDAVLPNYNNRDLMRRTACGYQILPGTDGMDGFYYASLVRKVT